MWIKRHLSQTLAAGLLLLSALGAHADVALVRQLDGPVVSGGNLFSDTRSDTNFGQTDRSWNPSFRTASASDGVYMVGWAASDGTPNPNYDGFITKLDPAGAEVWSKPMREIMGSYEGSRGWRLDDIKVLNGNLYVCGQKTDGDAFIAKITSNGTLQEYSLIVADSGGDVPIKETTANSLAVSVVNGQETIVVVGNVTGNSMEISERQIANPANVFGGLKLKSNENSLILSDAYIVRFDNSLRATWATTLGFQHSSDYATAVEMDPLGSIFVALQFEAADRNGSSRIWWIADDRKVFWRDRPDGVTVVTANVFPDPGWDFAGVTFEDQLSWSALFRLDPSGDSLIENNGVVTGVQPFKGTFYPTVV